MTEENRCALIQAYKYSIEANQDGIADLLEGVILGEMDKSEVPVTDTGPFQIPTTPTTPWHVTCEPLGSTGTYVGMAETHATTMKEGE